jgi:predicted enzyme related to lactoylglutathione lyase
MIEAVSAITLATHDMQRAVQFYSSLGFEIRRGGEAASFTSLCAGPICLNLIAQPEQKQWTWWGRIICHVDDVDACYERALKAGHQPSTAPRDAEWGERYFHLTDPDGHELSFARPLRKPVRGDRADLPTGKSADRFSGFRRIRAW